MLTQHAATNGIHNVHCNLQQCNVPDLNVMQAVCILPPSVVGIPGFVPVRLCILPVSYRTLRRRKPKICHRLPLQPIAWTVRARRFRLGSVCLLPIHGGLRCYGSDVTVTFFRSLGSAVFWLMEAAVLFGRVSEYLCGAIDVLACISSIPQQSLTPPEIVGPRFEHDIEAFTPTRHSKSAFHGSGHLYSNMYAFAVRHRWCSFSHFDLIAKSCVDIVV